MPKNIVIVESPAKARTIARFLGDDYEVISSYGHVRDLPKKGLGVDIEHGFEPTYEISPDKKKVVTDLKRESKGKTVWLASDEDREGEAIAWHIAYLLGLNPKKTNRIVFHEITKPAITEAIAKPRTIDPKLVDAQQTRRILDRLVGYELSPVLWKKVRTGLSAGRVQSVAVRLIVEREREIKAFQTKGSFKITATFDVKGQGLGAELDRRIDRQEIAKDFLSGIAAATFSIASVEQKPGQRNPGAPFTTSTLQQEAARRLGYSVRQTMSLAQRLYEEGHITYMRTDSTILSSLAITAAGKYIVKNFGAKYAQTRQFKTKNQAAQEAHEAIRPTSFDKSSAGSDAQQKKLYELIWRRAVASQMAPASIRKTEVSIDISGRAEKFLATGEVVVFDGFMKVYGAPKEDRLLPPLRVGQTLELVRAEATETFERAPARYSEANLVRKLEELGIGRPSTYAPTISTIQDRGYVEKKDLEGEPYQAAKLILEKGQVTETSEEIRLGSDRGKLLPTHVAEVVTDFLIKYFGSIVDYDFTARAEEEFDDIAEGRRQWRQALTDFYAMFHPLIQESAKASRAEAAQARELGQDPKTGQPVIARYGRYGPMLQLGSTENESEKPKFAPLPAGASLEDITLEQALPMFKLPRLVGKTADGEEITANIGRFGPYIKVGQQFVSLKEDDPLAISEAKANQLYRQHLEAAKKKLIRQFDNLRILQGPYGPYVTDGRKNARVPKNQDPARLSEAQAREILEKAAARPRFRRGK